MPVMPYNPDRYRAIAESALEEAHRVEQVHPGRVETQVIVALATCLTAVIGIAEEARALCRDDFPIPEGGRLKADHLISWKAASAAALLGVQHANPNDSVAGLVAKLAESLGMAADELIRVYAASAK